MVKEGLRWHWHYRVWERQRVGFVWNASFERLSTGRRDVGLVGFGLSCDLVWKDRVREVWCVRCVGFGVVGWSRVRWNWRNVVWIKEVEWI